MGDQVAKLSYGVILSDVEYKTLYDLFYENRKREDSIFTFKVEKDSTTFLTMDQPYDTGDHLLIVRESKQSSFNGTRILKGFESFDYKKWNSELEKFIADHRLKPFTEIGWMLTAHYN